MIITQPILSPRPQEKGYRTLAKGYRLDIYDVAGEHLGVKHLNQLPDLKALHQIIPEGGRACIEQALYVQKGRIVWQPKAWFFNIDDAVVKSYVERLSEPVRKEASNILDPDGFENYIDNAASDISKATASKDAAGLASLNRSIRKNEKLMTPAGMEQFQKRIGNAYSRGTDGIWNSKALDLVLKKNGTISVRKAGQQTLSYYSKAITFNPTVVDANQIELMSGSKGFYVKDEYGNRPQWIADRAKSTMTPMFEQGLGREEMSKALQKQFSDALPTKDRNYWTTVADNHMSRSRAWGISSGMLQGGIVTAYYQSVLDEATTKICRAVNGTEISIPAARGLATAAEAAPGGLETVNPFMRAVSGKRTDMVQIPSSFSRGEPASWKTLYTAPSKQTGAGTFGTGKWSPAFDENDPNALPAEGAGFPPLHHR